MARPRKPIDSDRRGALMREARSSFALPGYAGTSLSSVLRASGFPRSSFYYFYDGKKALLDEAFADGLSRLAACAPPPDPGAITTTTFWHRLFGFVDALAAADADPDLAAPAPLPHARRPRLGEARVLRARGGAVVRRGRAQQAALRAGYGAGRWTREAGRTRRGRAGTTKSGRAAKPSRRSTPNRI